MKIAHWVMMNKSGMNRVAESLVEAEKKLGIDSHLCNINAAGPDCYHDMLDCDVHVSHTHFPDWMRRKVTKPLKLVWVGHGTPEHVFQTSVEAGASKGYGHGDGVMLVQNWLRTADACVTFWPRHQAIWQSMCDRNTKVHCVPLGVDKSFWKKTPTRGKYDGSPSLLTCENPHYIKWPLDLFIAWPWVYPKLEGSPKLHSLYLPNDMHRWFFPLVNRNGCSYASHISPMTLGHEDLRNAFNSVDYYIGLVRYGDFNRVGLEANASGTKSISYRGNPYSDYWITEGDQRTIADELIDILSGKVEPRKKDEVPDVMDTAKGMIEIYKSILPKESVPVNTELSALAPTTETVAALATTLEETFSAVASSTDSALLSKADSIIVSSLGSTTDSSLVSTMSSKVESSLLVVNATQ